MALRITIGFVGPLRERVRAAAAVAKQALVAEMRAITRDIFTASQRRVTTVVHVRTGHLRRAAAYSVQETPTGVEGLIAYRAPYASFVEAGTRPHEIRPRRRQALRFLGADGRPRFARRVQHPGTRPRPFLWPSVHEIWARAKERLKQAILARV